MAAAQVEQNRQALNLAQTRLAYAQVTAPIDGVILSKNIEPGEYVSLGTPWLQLVNSTKSGLRLLSQKQTWVKFSWDKKFLSQLTPIRTKAIANYSYIASEAEFTPKNIQTAEERVKLVYRIKIMIDNAAHELKPGMPADAVIKLGMTE